MNPGTVAVCMLVLILVAILIYMVTKSQAPKSTGGTDTTKKSESVHRGGVTTTSGDINNGGVTTKSKTVYKKESINNPTPPPKRDFRVHTGF